MAFFDIEFENISTHNCTECWSKKNEYLNKEKLSLKEAKKTVAFINQKCEHHISFPTYQQPSFCTLYKEKENELGNFDKYTFSNDSLNIGQSVCVNAFKFDYDFENVSIKTKAKQNKRKKAKTSTVHINKIIKKETKSVMEHFAAFLICNNFDGYTFLSLNHQNSNMSAVMEIFLKMEMRPKFLAKNGVNFVKIAFEAENLFFINSSNYLKGSYHDICTQYNLKMDDHYFPAK